MGEVEPIKATVKWFDNVRSYGFLEGKDGHEYFLHYSAIDPDSDPRAEIIDGKRYVTLRTFQEVEIVSFREEPKGRRATKVRKMP